MHLKTLGKTVSKNLIQFLIQLKIKNIKTIYGLIFL